jgi:hypothetical protein
MEQYNEYIEIVMAIVKEFVEKYEALAPQTKGLNMLVSNAVDTFMVSREIIFRNVVMIVVEKIAIFKDLIDDKNPIFWSKLDLFGVDMQKFWLAPAMTRELKECVWNYLKLFVEACVSANKVTVQDNIKNFDWMAKAAIAHSASIKLPAVLSMMSANLEKMQLTKNFDELSADSA